MEHRQWRVSQVARVVLALVIVAAVVGFFGPGPVSWTEASDGALTASYERFTRRGGTSALRIEVGPEAATQEAFEVRIDRSYLSNFEITSITPEPDSARTTGTWITYTFKTDDPGEGLEVTYSLTPTGLWAADGEIALPTGETVSLSHFIYP